ncbi:MAG: hypothetical protein WB607_29170, partial [Candidatus Acidiferrum sp.]
MNALRALLVLTAGLVLALPSFAADQNFHQTYPLSAGGSFALENVNGSVQVEGWSRDEVEVSATKTGHSDPHDMEQVKIQVDSCPGHVAVHTYYPKGEGADVAVEYHVHVPYRV